MEVTFKKNNINTKNSKIHLQVETIAEINNYDVTKNLKIQNVINGISTTFYGVE